MIGDVTAINGTITALKENRLLLKIVKGLQDYLSCKVKFSRDKKRAWLGQTISLIISQKNLLFCDGHSEL